MKRAFCRTALIPLAAVAVLALPVQALAQTSRLYVAGYLGLSTFNSLSYNETATPSSGTIKFSNATSFGGALGLRITPRIRVEGELSYRRSDPGTMHINGQGDFDGDGQLKTWLAMANAYYDFDVSWKNLQPFVGAGIGIASHDLSIVDRSGFAADSEGDSLALAWQVGGGAKYRLSPTSALTGSYRYIDTSEIESDSYSVEYGTHEIRMGLEYDLPVGTFRGLVK